MNKNTLVLLFAFLPVAFGGVMGLLLGGLDPSSAKEFLESRGSSISVTMLCHGALWGMLISAAQMVGVAGVLAAVALVQRGEKSAIVR